MTGPPQLGLPQLTLFDAENQQLYSKPPLDDEALHPISSKHGHPKIKAHFGHLDPGSRCFGHDLNDHR